MSLEWCGDTAKKEGRKGELPNWAWQDVSGWTDETVNYKDMWSLLGQQSEKNGVRSRTDFFKALNISEINEKSPT